MHVANALAIYCCRIDGVCIRYLVDFDGQYQLGCYRRSVNLFRLCPSSNASMQLPSARPYTSQLIRSWRDAGTSHVSFRRADTAPAKTFAPRHWGLPQPRSPRWLHLQMWASCGIHCARRSRHSAPRAQARDNRRKACFGL